MSLNTLIIDDHPLVAEGLANLVSSLEEDVSVVSAQSAQLGIEKALQEQPDLILLDLHMPDMDGFDALEILSAKLDTTAIVVVSGSQDTQDMQRAIASGAMGYIPKTVSHKIMLNALKLIISGGVYIPPEMLTSSPARISGIGKKLQDNSLTPRQIQVLKLLSKGKVNKEIARTLDCAETTVKAHITAIFRELKARNRTEAVVNAQRRGLIDS